ncbi:hypothetical protein HY224_00475 [Candidatus Uhrbacteria bacterium]|nr:hypothetical protein [Candidatus Uhrbacteria bacterium]
MKIHSKFLVGAAMIFLTLTAQAEGPPDSLPLSTPLVAKAQFLENEQASTMIHPHSIDGSTNVAFYLDIDGTMWWQAEQLGSLGDLPFSKYWEPTPATGKYVAVEYVNDIQQFSCSGLTLNDCLSDPHFIDQFSFVIN